MKRWLPYVIAVLFGVLVAAAMFWPSTSTTSRHGTASAGAASTPAATPSTVSTEGVPPESPSGTTAPPTDPAGATASPPRATTAAEVASAARRTRPYNQHYQAVASLWRQSERLAATDNADLARECGLMEELLRSQSRLNDDEADIAATLQKEITLAQKVKAAGLSDPQVGRMMEYIIETAQLTLQGGDPTTVHRPTSAELKGG